MNNAQICDILREYETDPRHDEEVIARRKQEQEDAARENVRRDLIRQISSARTGKQLYPYPKCLHEQKRYNALCKQYESIFGRGSLRHAEFTPGIMWLRGQRKAA